MELHGLKHNIEKREKIIIILDYIKKNIKNHNLKIQTINGNFFI